MGRSSEVRTDHSYVGAGYPPRDMGDGGAAQQYCCCSRYIHQFCIHTVLSAQNSVGSQRCDMGPPAMGHADGRRGMRRAADDSLAY